MKNTPIQWCDATINPAMGCDGCELWPPGVKIRNLIFKKYEENNIKIDKDHFNDLHIITLTNITLSPDNKETVKSLS